MKIVEKCINDYLNFTKKLNAQTLFDKKGVLQRMPKYIRQKNCRKKIKGGMFYEKNKRNNRKNVNNVN